jgi:hypothetical protein
MAAKTPDSGTPIIRVVAGSVAWFFLPFSGSNNLDDGDTVDLSPYCSTVINAWFDCDAATGTPGRTLTGTGNVTFTVKLGANDQTGILTVVGNP